MSRRGAGYEIKLNFKWSPAAPSKIGCQVISRQNTSLVRNGNPLEGGYSTTSSCSELFNNVGERPAQDTDLLSLSVNCLWSCCKKSQTFVKFNLTIIPLTNWNTVLSVELITVSLDGNQEYKIPTTAHTHFNVIFKSHHRGVFLHPQQHICNFF